MSRRLARHGLLAISIIWLAACTPRSGPGPAQESPETATPIDAPAPARASQTFRDCADCPEMVEIPAGAFTMGSPESEPGRQPDEGPQHKVTIARRFAVGAYEVTYGQYARFIEATGRKDYHWTIRDQSIDEERARHFPVAAISWQDAKDYAAWLTQQTGKPYRLLTEAEWEYVARAGTTDPREAPETQSGAWQPLQEEVNFTYRVGSFKPNAFGVYDLTANMPEWVEDCYRDSYAGAPLDGSAVEGTCRQRVVRGTYNGYDAQFGAARRVANRDWNYAVNPDNPGRTGLRVARDLP